MTSPVIIPLLFRVYQEPHPLLGLPKHKQGMQSSTQQWWNLNFNSLGHQHQLWLTASPLVPAGPRSPWQKQWRSWNQTVHLLIDNKRQKLLPLTLAPIAPGIPGTPWKTEEWKREYQDTEDKLFHWDRRKWNPQQMLHHIINTYCICIHDMFFKLYFILFFLNWKKWA